MNSKKAAPGFHKESHEASNDMMHPMLDILAYDTAIVLIDGVHVFAEHPIATAERLHFFLCGQFGQTRDNECAEILKIINGILGIEYDVVTNLLNSKTEARSYFLYSFITELGELLEDYPEQP